MFLLLLTTLVLLTFSGFSEFLHQKWDLIFSDNSCTTISTEAKLTDKTSAFSSGFGFGLKFQQNVEVRKQKQYFGCCCYTIFISGDHDQDYDSNFYQLPVRCENVLDNCTKKESLFIGVLLL